VIRTLLQTQKTTRKRDILNIKYNFIYSQIIPRMKLRCEWAANGSPIDIEYHDKEWGVPVHSDKKLFEFLLLESAQAGLSWSIILKKREGYRKAFDDFDANKVAHYDQRRIQKLVTNPSIIRNKLKIQSAITNARAFLKLQQEFGSFDSYLWNFVDGRPKQNEWKSWMEIPSRTEISDLLSKDLKRTGFVFVGSTICYSMMQAVGMVNDHTVYCFRYKDLI
jgi:DNA-3-methyladenine glycosylase I